jgi:PAS domain S-box-containing protein
MVTAQQPSFGDESHYRNLFACAPVGIWEADCTALEAWFGQLRAAGITDLGSFLETDPQQILYGLSLVTIRSVNQASVGFYGANDEQHLLENAPWLLATVPLPSLREALVARWNGEVSFRMETHIATLHGTRIHGLVGISVPKEADRQDLSRIILTFTDITDRKRTEETLRESGERLRMAMGASGTGWWDWDLTANALVLDEQCKTLLGVPLTAEVTYEVVREHLRPEDRPRLDQTLARALAESGEYELECAAEWPDGSVHWALLRGRSFHDAANRPVRLMGVAVDITDRRRAEAALRESEQFYRTLIETLPVTVVLANPTGRVTYISPAAKEMFGLTRGEGLGTLPTDWIAPEHHEAVGYRMQQVLVELNPQPPIEYKMLKRDRTPVWAQVASSPILDAEGHLQGVVTVCQDITARRQAEEALRENEARLRLAQQAAHAGTWDLDLSTGRAFVSTETWGLWGVEPRENPQSFDWLAAVFPEDRPVAETTLQQAMRTPGDASWEYRITWPNGQVRWHHARGRTLADPDGRPRRLVGITTDVTERKQAEQKLRESEERLRLAIQGAEMGWWDWDLLTDAMTADDQCKALYGMPPSTRPSYDLTIELTHPEDRPLLQQRIQEARESPDAREVELRTVWPNGTVRWLLLRGQAFRDERGRPVRLMGLVMDVSARKLAEQALRESETRFKAIYEQAPLGIALVNSRTGQFLQINAKYREIIGRSEEEMRGLTFQGISHPDDLQADLDNMARLIEGESRFFKMEKRLVRGDGSLIWVNLTVVPMWEAGQPPHSHIAIVEDITERKRAEAEIKVLNETLEQRVTQRTTQLRALASELAQAEQRERRRLAQILHDHLQQLLVAAKLKTGMLSRRVQDEGMTRLLRQINELLEESLTQSRSLTVELSPPVLYDRGLAGGLEWLARQFEEKHDLRVGFEFDPQAEPADEGTRVFLFQAIRELLLNIVKHAQAPSAHISLARRGEDWLWVEVSDTGPGFDPATLENREPGKGFGLFTIRERLELIGGRVKVETAPGRGTKVVLEVPRGQVVSPAGLTRKAVAAVSTAALDSEIVVAEPVPGQRSVRVLVADDHRVVREGLITMLQEQPAIKVIGEAADGQQALDLTLRMKPEVVLMDISMPVLDGIEATRRITQALPGVRVIGLSMHVREDMARAMREAGAADYMSKDTASDHLIDTILQQAAAVAPS